MPREEAYSEVPGRGPIAASFKPVDPIVVLVYQSLTLSTSMLSSETVLIVTVKSLTAPVPRPAAATVTETTEFDIEPETSAQTSDPSETTEEKPS